MKHKHTWQSDFIGYAAKSAICHCTSGCGVNALVKIENHKHGEIIAYVKFRNKGGRA
jgi:hypothetical protein